MIKRSILGGVSIVTKGSRVFVNGVVVSSVQGPVGVVGSSPPTSGGSSGVSLLKSVIGEVKGLGVGRGPGVVA